MSYSGILKDKKKIKVLSINIMVFLGVFSVSYFTKKKKKNFTHFLLNPLTVSNNCIVFTWKHQFLSETLFPSLFK